MKLPIDPKDENAITPRDDQTISIAWTYPYNFPNYEKFHDVRFNANLPANFKTKFEPPAGHIYDWVDLFADTKSTPYQAVYCTEINRHLVYHAPDQSEAPTSNIDTDDKIKLLTYVLTRGQKFYRYDDEASIKREIATQLAVWLIAEGVYTSLIYDSPAIDSVLGGTTSLSAQFAPTREIGDMARGLLDAARMDAVNPSPLPLYPSFATAAGIPRPEYEMVKTGSGSYVLSLVDTNNILWDYPESITINAGSLNFTVEDSALILSGDPGAHPGTTITLSSDFFAGGTMLYLSTDKTEAGTGEPIQKMARFARVKGVAQTVYLRIYRAVDAPDPGDNTIDDLIRLNGTVTDVVTGAAQIEIILQNKLKTVLNLMTSS